MTLRGRIDADFLWASQDQESRANYGSLQDAVGLRRARIGAVGTFADDAGFLAEIDLASYRGLQPPWNDWEHVASRGRWWAEALADLLLREPEDGA